MFPPKGMGFFPNSGKVYATLNYPYTCPMDDIKQTNTAAVAMVSKNRKFVKLGIQSKINLWKLLYLSWKAPVSSIMFQNCQETVLPLLQGFAAFDSVWLNAIFINDTNVFRDLFIANSTLEYGVDVIKVGFHLPAASRDYINRWVNNVSYKLFNYLSSSSSSLGI